MYYYFSRDLFIDAEAADGNAVKYLRCPNYFMEWSFNNNTQFHYKYGY